MAVFKKNGAWWIDTYVNGQRVRRKVGPDKRTAQLAEKDLKVRAARGEWLGISQVKRITFDDFFDRFLTRQAGRAEGTISNYRKAKKHFSPIFGTRFLTSIRLKDVEDYVQERAQEANFNTVNLELRQLKALLNAAVRWGYLRENPAKGAKPLRVPEKEPPYLTRDEISALYAFCNDWLYTFVAIALNTGLRLSEILSLTWEDVDMRRRVIKIRSDETFTTKGRRNREVPINDFLHQVLKKAPRHITNPHVITNRSGNCPHQANVRDRLRLARKKAGIEHLRVHDLRHTFGTWLAAEGVDVVTIKDLMGHANVNTTMKYLHAAPDRNRWAVQNLHLDGTTQAERESKKTLEMHATSQDLDTGTSGKQTPTL